MSEIIYVGVCARVSGKRSGKDTFADALVASINEFAENSCENIIAVKRAFADPLKMACKEIYSLTDEQVWGVDKETLTKWEWPEKFGKSGYMTARDIQQVFGSEVMRYSFEESVWIKSLEIWAESLAENKPEFNFIVVVPDVRFLNEAEFCDYLVDVYRNDAEVANQDGHVSELSGRLITDEMICAGYQNNGTKEELEAKAVEFKSQLLANLAVTTGGVFLQV